MTSPEFTDKRGPNLWPGLIATVVVSALLVMAGPAEAKAEALRSFKNLGPLKAIQKEAKQTKKEAQKRGLIRSQPGVSAFAMRDIPSPKLIRLYQDAAKTCQGLPWSVVAGHAKVESGHGTFGGAKMDASGDVRPKIIGIPLNGGNNTMRITDSDNGKWDGDTTFDRAVGPMQFIPSSWRIFGADGNRDGLKDPHNYYDAVYGAANHLCKPGLSKASNLRRAIYSYNRSWSYVCSGMPACPTQGGNKGVLYWANRYGTEKVG